MKISLRAKKPSKIILVATTFILLLVVAYFFLSTSPNDENEMMIEKSNFASTIVTTGKITSDHIITVKTKVAGTVSICDYKEGDAFAKDDILLQFEPSDFDNLLQEAQLGIDTAYNNLKVITEKELVDAEEQVTQARLEQEKAEENYQNNQVLFEAGVISKDELDNAKATMDSANSKLIIAENQKKSLLPQGVEYDNAVLNIRNAEIRLADARTNVENTKVKAPFDGTILKKYCEQGEFVEVGKDLFLIADNHEELYIKASVDEKYIANLKEGLKVYIHPEASDAVAIDGRIRKIAPSVDSQKGTIDIEISLGSIPEYFKRDLSVSLEIITEEYSNVIVLEKKYIDFSSDPKVLVKQGNSKLTRDIVITNDFGNKVIVGAGLQEGEIISLPDEKS